MRGPAESGTIRNLPQARPASGSPGDSKPMPTMRHTLSSPSVRLLRAVACAMLLVVPFVARGQAGDDLVQVDLPALGPVGTHDGVALGIDAEVAVAPGIDAVEVERVLDVPGAGVASLAFGVFHCLGRSTCVRCSGRKKEARTIVRSGGYVNRNLREQEGPEGPEGQEERRRHPAVRGSV